ncbi:MAG: Putative hydroxypyruvate reductase/glycerate kinase [Leptospirillum sp. Group II 'C75']|uniref:Glycerate kinase n=1 Tax=Leptospirillum ferriphilum TaxID=178606 RepID=A0A1V3SWN9_9BACT|nr:MULTISPECIES: DUF4147 domain-containing protein [Leptospirillum]EAY56768.1 MAG: putative hydroxypyruvate reductase/glycerate kinase [Leptospirillum rubarum]EIJ76691.1 MAG: Putative hydroxypyruvate reductase/glycerate kinase [Leptospirillum sp. Group II 'C75']MCL4405793.1 DUF4147 domain-containing protein [Bacillota bacterium]AKS24022.1 hypothetical protein ABH19_10165 [Leptospirillum sp. Group II 'CF-1']OOH73676.1 hypothetical protein BOX24_03370 [Leptospirillum ferriphilum]
MTVPPDLRTFQSDLIPRLRTLLGEIQPSALLESSENPLYPPSKEHPEFLLAVGKASKGMAEALAEKRSIPPDRVLVILPSGYPCPERYGWRTGNHPDPGEDSLNAAEAALDFVGNIPPGGVLLFALSGGTSSLLCKPARGISLAQKKNLIGLLMRKGAPIHILNTVRTHLSLIKGGELLRNFRGQHVHTVLLSDVPCQSAGIVGSGPTVFCQRDGKKTLSILEEWLDPEDIPDCVRQHLETLPPLSPPPLSREPLHVLGDSGVVLKKAAEVLSFSGHRIHRLTHCLSGESRVQGERIGDHIRDIADRKPGNHLFLASGECTVTLGKTHGRGGRALELGIACGLSLKNYKTIVGALATDGMDGNSGYSGVLLESALFRQKEMEKKGLRCLETHDTASFVHEEEIGLSFGPSGTNLNDLLFVYLFPSTEALPT